MPQEQDKTVQLGNPKEWHIITRHQPTIDLLQTQGIGGSTRKHLEVAEIDTLFKPGDTVVGVLPIHLIAELNKRGINFLSYEMDVPANLQNLELSQEIMKKACFPRLTHYTCEEVKDAHIPDAFSVCGQFTPRATEDWLKAEGHKVVNEVTKDMHLALRSGDFRVGPEDAVAGELLARDAAMISAQGAQYFQIAMPGLPVEKRGQRISVEEMDRFGAKLQAFNVSRGKTLDLSGEKEISVDHSSVVRKYTPSGVAELFEQEQNAALQDATGKAKQAIAAVKKTNALVEQDQVLQEMKKLSEDLIVEKMYAKASAGASKNKVVHLVLGLPGSGKSSVVGKTLMKEYGAFELDSDLIKDQLPGYMHGYGAGAVHEQSDALMKRIMQKALDDGVAIMHPVIGKTMDVLEEKIKLFKDNGYDVYAHIVQVPREVSVHRVVDRHNETGRYVDPGYVMSIDPEKIERNFDKLAHDPRISGYSEWDNHVEFGDKPILLRAHNVKGVPDKEGVDTKGKPELTGNTDTVDVALAQRLKEVG